MRAPLSADTRRISTRRDRHRPARRTWRDGRSGRSDRSKGCARPRRSVGRLRLGEPRGHRAGLQGVRSASVPTRVPTLFRTKGRFLFYLSLHVLELLEPLEPRGFCVGTPCWNLLERKVGTGPVPTFQRQQRHFERSRRASLAEAFRACQSASAPPSTMLAVRT